MSLKEFSKKIINRFSAPHYYIGSVEDNKSGELQLNRVRKQQKEWTKNPSHNNPKFKKEEEILDRDGLLIIPNFFTDEVFKEITKEVELYKKSGQVKSFPNKDNFGVDWETGYLAKGAFSALDEHLRKNEMILELVKHTTRKDVLHLPEIVYQKLSLPMGGDDNTDVNRINHADRFYPTIKVVLLTEDVTPEQGPFMYSKGTHLLNEKRFKFEEKVAFYNALLKEGRSDEIPPEWIFNKRIVPPKSLYEDQIGTPIVGKANTLAVINTCGFHYRGELQPGYSRECLRLVFHYVYSPPFAQNALNLINLPPGRFLN